MRLAAFALKIYRLFLSPALHLLAGGSFGCRFEPTCSHYAEMAFSRFPPGRATRMTLLRISRCHPFSRSAGWDPVATEHPMSQVARATAAMPVLKDT